MLDPIISVAQLNKTYDSGTVALASVDLDIKAGEILALLGPNGAGKTTLISMICGLLSHTSGSVKVGGFDVVTDYRKARNLIGLVPQEVMLEPFETVLSTVRFSRGLFGYPPDAQVIEGILKQLSLWDKRDTQIKELSGGMKRRVLIAKALSHHPKVLFLDEPTAGVDVELRKDMWNVVADLKAQGVTILLTTHYIEEAEAIADRVAVIAKGQILLIEDKEALMKRMGTKELHIHLQDTVTSIPDSLGSYDLVINDDKMGLVYSYDTKAERTGITSLLSDISSAGLVLRDLQTAQSSLEDIFVDLVKD
ncbi:ABC transporter ATP-binding protein [Candidatus Puniceispirillum sp.]|jgi:ABC-2 type transport system ATP-binding protein|uniref:ABC transporter ATP-binding protein n=1 Tax=uncultured Candidatus Puniceispirillum sp. TaxID=1985115 RepID=UPI001EBB5304|nr:ABC transporter ATP-binding protein [Candidatus Puniceispirillum sp.]MBT6565475.1 ABC transporter ATP-binding protein [Candidatus Puniceispirillum sp.]